MKETGKQNQETVERETVPCDGQSADDELRAKVVSPHAPKELGDSVRALEKDKQESRQTKDIGLPQTQEIIHNSPANLAT